MASNFCSRCGRPVVPGQSFCGNCGTPLSGGPPPPPVSAPSYSSPPPYSPYPAVPAGPYAAPYGYGPAPYGSHYGHPYGYPVPHGYPYLPPPQKTSAGRMIGDAFKAYGQDFLTYIGIFLLLALAIEGVNLGVNLAIYGTPETDPFQAFQGWGGFLIMTIGLGIFDAVVTAFVVTGVTHFAVQRHRGNPVSLGEAFRASFDRFPSVLGAAILLMLMVLGLVVIPLGIAVAGASSLDLAAVFGGFCLLILLLPVILYLYVMVSLYAPAIVMEKKGAVAGLLRSWQLVKGRWWTLFAAILVVFILAAIVSFAAVVPLAYLENPWLVPIGTIVGTAITGSWMPVLSAVAYDLIVSEPTPWVPYGQPATAWATPPPYAQPFVQPYGPPPPPPPP